MKSLRNIFKRHSKNEKKKAHSEDLNISDHRLFNILRVVKINKKEPDTKMDVNKANIQ